MSDLSGVWLALISSVVTGLVSAFAAAGWSAWFSLRRYYRERWWEKKFEAYATIVDALHHMSRSFEEDFKAHMYGGEVREPLKSQLDEKYTAGRNELLRSTDIGEFLISPSAVSLLRQLWRDLAKRHEDYAEYLDESGAAINNCLKSMRELVRSDLHGPV